MADFPDNTLDPSSEEEGAQKRALTLGLVTAGLGILAQPRYRGEPASVPIARGALGGVEAYTGELGAAEEEATKRRQFQLEQSKLDAETAYRNQEIQDRQRALDIQDRSATSLEGQRKIAEQANMPVGDAGVQMVQPFLNDPSTGAIAKSLSPEQIKAMPYARFQDWRNGLLRTYNAAHNPNYVLTTVTDDAGIHVLQHNTKGGGTPEVVYSGTEHNKERAPTEAQRRWNSIVEAHPEWKGHDDLIQKAYDQEKLDNASQAQYDKLKQADEFAQQREARQNQARKDLADYTAGLKSRADIQKILAKPVNIGGTGFAPTVGVNPVTNRPAIKYTPIGLALFTKPVFVDLPSNIAGGIPDALAPPGRKLNLPPEQLSALQAKVSDGQTFKSGGKLYRRAGNDFIDVTNPPPGAPAAAAAPASATSAAAASAAPAPAAAPSAAPSPAAPAAAPSVASAPVRGTRVAAPTLYRGKDGKPAYNAKTGQFLYVDDKGNAVDQNGRLVLGKDGKPIALKSGA